MPKSDTKDTTRFVTYKFTFLFSKTHNKSINYFMKYVVDVTNNYVYCQLAKKISLSHTSIYNSFVIKLTLTIDNVRKISEPMVRALKDLQEGNTLSETIGGL